MSLHLIAWLVKEDFHHAAASWNIVNNGREARVLTGQTPITKRAVFFEKLAETAQWKSKDLQIEAMLSALHCVCV